MVLVSLGNPTDMVKVTVLVILHGNGHGHPTRSWDKLYGNCVRLCKKKLLPAQATHTRMTCCAIAVCCAPANTKAVLLRTAFTMLMRSELPSVSSTLPLAPADWTRCIFSLQFCCPARRLKPVVGARKVLKAPCCYKFSPRVFDSSTLTCRISAFW